MIKHLRPATNEYPPPAPPPPNCLFFTPAAESRALAQPLSAGLTNHACLKTASTAIIANCGPWDDYSLKYVRVVAELCQAGIEAAAIAAAASRVCDSAPGHADEVPEFEVSAGAGVEK